MTAFGGGIDESTDGTDRPQFESTDTLKAARFLKFVTILKLLRNIFKLFDIRFLISVQIAIFKLYYSNFEKVLKGDETGQGASQLGRSKFKMFLHVSYCVTELCRFYVDSMFNIIF